MSIQILNVATNLSALQPELIIDLKVTYYNQCQIPTNVRGRLIARDGKILANLEEYDYSDRRSLLLNQSNRKDKFHVQNQDQVRLKVSAPLSAMALAYIEKMRDKDAEKNVYLKVQLLIDYFTDNSDAKLRNQLANYNDPLLKVDTEQAFAEITISNSDWINKYTYDLGYGKFLLLELESPDVNNDLSNFKKLPKKYTSIKTNFVQRYAKLHEYLNQMSKEIKSGEWDLVMRYSREFFEHLKLGKNSLIETELRELFQYRNGTDTGFTEFYEGLLSMFEYSSKFIHGTDKKNQLQEKPKAMKEDAYFTYSLCVNILNLISKKVANF